MQWVTGAHSHGVNQPGNKTDISPQSTAKVKNERKYTSTPPCAQELQPLISAGREVGTHMNVNICIYFITLPISLHF